MEKNLLLRLSHEGFNRVIEETRNFDRIVKGVYEMTAMEVYSSTETPGIAIFAYGSPGRIELIGGDSDADIFIAEREKNPQSERFKHLLKERWGRFDFSKVDVPPWTAYKEIDVYLAKSLVEGNQVLETRFLAGDKEVLKEIEGKKQHFDSVERELRNIIFNRLYFNQYFRQRMRGEAVNVKYCPGGSRDFLFVYWNDRLNNKIRGETESQPYIPKIKQGLQRLLDGGKIDEREFLNSLEAISFSMTLRSDILKINKGNSDRGLTLLDDKTMDSLQTLGYPSPKPLREFFEESRKTIENVSRIVWEDVIKIAGNIMGSYWEENFRLAYNPKTTENTRARISSNDSLISVALIWGASDSSQKNLFDVLAKKYKGSSEWAIIGSIVCSPLCSQEVLHHFGTGQLKEEGYGYLLRVVARNKNDSVETLESIAEDPRLEKRYIEVAQAALKGGSDLANNQI